MSNLIDETGNKYGLLTVLYRGPNSKDGRVQWHCRCDCGNEVDVIAKNLRSGNTKSCGCYKRNNPGMRKDLTGKRYGKLVVLGEPQIGKRGTIWKCQCDCGNICYKVSTDLIHGSTKSCGCLKAELHSTMNDLTGQQFGELTALYSDKVANDDQRIWHCKCRCGKEVDIRAGALRSGKTKSCGCKTSKGNLTIRNFLQDHQINFIQEYSFNDLYVFSHNTPLRFDFAIFKNQTLSCLIEYNGKQHYEPVEYFGGKESLKKQQKNDSLKKEYCQKNNIKLYIIDYTQNILTEMEKIIYEI